MGCNVGFQYRLQICPNIVSKNETIWKSISWVIVYAVKERVEGEMDGRTAPYHNTSRLKTGV